MSGFQKNVAGQKWLVFAFDKTNNNPKTGDAANITAKIRKDYGAATATNDVAPTEIEDGYYEFNLLQAETNADVLDLLPESSTANIQVIGVTGRIFTVPPNFSSLGIESDGDLIKVNTLNLHIAQTGDSFARIGATGSGLSSLAQAAVCTEVRLVELAAANLPSDIDTLIARLTAARAGYFDNLNIGEFVAGSSEVTSIQNNTRAVRVVPSMMERPDSGSTVFRIELLLYDDVGNMEAPDAVPTISAVNQAGTSRDVNLDSTTMTLVSTGRYRSTYTIATAHAIEELIFAFSVIEGGSTRIYGNAAQVVDTTAVDFTTADRAKLDTLHDTRLTAARATNLDNLDAAITTRSNHNAAAVRAEMDANSAVLADLKDGGRLDLIFDLIKAATDQFVFVAGDVKATLDSETVTVGDKTGFSLSAGGVDAILDEVVEGTITLRQAQRAFLSALAGKLAGAATSTITTRDQADTKNRITATVDADGNRSVVTLDLT